MKKTIVTLIILVLSVASCSQAPSESMIQTAVAQALEAKLNEGIIQTAVAGTLAVMPPAIPEPTDTLEPTSTTPPKETPKPTNTQWPEILQPIDTAQPVETAPLSDAESVKFSGSGDEIIELAGVWSGPGILYVKSTGTGSFKIASFKENGEDNYFDVYEKQPVDSYYLLNVSVFGLESSYRLRIEADGPWEIIINPVDPKYIPYSIELPNKITGKDDTVIMLSGIPDLVSIKSNSDSLFWMVSYDKEWNGDSVMQETDPFDGKYIMPKDAVVLTVNADGPWEMEFTASK